MTRARSDLEFAREQRREKTAALAKRGITPKVIAASLGVSTDTVRLDLAQMGVQTARPPEPEQEASAPIEFVTVRCNYCSFAAVGTIEEARQAFDAHACDRPKPPPHRRRRRGYHLRRRNS